jgi:hypothetical protein
VPESLPSSKAAGSAPSLALNPGHLKSHHVDAREGHGFSRAEKGSPPETAPVRRNWQRSLWKGPTRRVIRNPPRPARLTPCLPSLRCYKTQHFRPCHRCKMPYTLNRTVAFRHNTYVQECPNNSQNGKPPERPLAASLCDFRSRMTLWPIPCPKTRQSAVSASAIAIPRSAQTAIPPPSRPYPTFNNLRALCQNGTSWSVPHPSRVCLGGDFDSFPSLASRPKPA